MKEPGYCRRPVSGVDLATTTRAQVTAPDIQDYGTRNIEEALLSYQSGGLEADTSIAVNLMAQFNFAAEIQGIQDLGGVWPATDSDLRSGLGVLKSDFCNLYQAGLGIMI